MLSIQIIVQRTIWAGCLGLALILNRSPIRALPTPTEQITPLPGQLWMMGLAQRLGLEMGSIVAGETTYAFTDMAKLKLVHRSCHDNKNCSLEQQLRGDLD